MKRTLILFTTLLITFVTKADNITFVDSNVKSICVERWSTDGDEELSMDEAAAVTYLGDAFSFNNDIVQFPELQYFTGLKEIESYSFYNCKNLKAIQLPSSITNISTSAFYGCLSLQEVLIPGSVKTIADYAFNGCVGLQELSLPEGVTTIGQYAFNSCSSLQSLHIPSTVTSITVSSFWACSSLTSVTVDEDNAVYDSRGECNAIINTTTNTLFLGTVATVIPSSVTTIGPSSFYGNSKLKTIEIPEGVQAIGGSAFSGCTALTSINLPTTLTTISNGAFSGCTKLAKVQLPNGLKTIETNAFLRCSNLRKIHIPATVTSIGSYAFSECSKLLKVAVDFSSPLTINSMVFSHRKLATLYVPKGCYSAYKNANYWKEFKSIVELTDNTLAVTVEPEAMMAGESAALNVSLENDEFFSYRKVQMDITLPEGFSLDADAITPSDRCAGMTVALEPMEGNVYRLTCSSESAAITGKEGVLLTMGLKADKGVGKGDYQGMAANIMLTDDYGSSRALADTEFNWSFAAYYMGDVNHSGTVDVTDVISTVDYILGIEPADFYVDRADMDGDNTIIITDLIIIIDTILGIFPLTY